MPRGSEELTNARKAEIVNACAVLYETRSFKEITLKEIGEKTSFTRTSIYNYFQTKEEIFLALFQREYEAWIEDLDALRCGHRKLSVDAFSDELARTLERRERLLKLMAMNHSRLPTAGGQCALDGTCRERDVGNSLDAGIHGDSKLVVLVLFFFF